MRALNLTVDVRRVSREGDYARIDYTVHLAGLSVDCWLLTKHDPDSKAAQYDLLTDAAHYAARSLL